MAQAPALHQHPSICLSFGICLSVDMYTRMEGVFIDSNFKDTRHKERRDQLGWRVVGELREDEDEGARAEGSREQQRAGRESSREQQRACA